MFPLSDSVEPRRPPLVTIAVVVASAVAYVLAAVQGGSLIGGPSGQTIVRYGAIPYEFSHWGQHCALSVLVKAALLCTGQPGVIGSAGPQPTTWETAFTAIFLHANIVDLAVNMVFLGVFGASVEGRLGHLGFLAFYLLAGLVALALAVLVAPDSAAATFGGSGAIAGVLGAYLVLYPRARIRTVGVLVVRVTFVELAAWVAVAGWFGFDAILGALGLSTAFGDAGVAYYAQWGGVVFGVLVALALIGRQRERQHKHRVAL